jgi:hypothetical protein
MADRADWVDRFAVLAGVAEPPEARRRLDDALTDSGDDAVEETNVVELAAFAAMVNRGLS